MTEENESKQQPQHGQANTGQRPVNCDEIQALIPAFSIGATDPEETERVLASLAHCPDAAAELADFAELTEGLHFSVPQQEPPPALARSLRAALHEPEQEPSFLPTAPARRPSSAPDRTGWWQSLLRGGSRLQLAAGFSALLLLLILSNSYWFARIENLQSQYDALVAQQNERNSFIAFTDPDALRRIELAAAGPEHPDSRAVLVFEPGRNQAMLYAEDFPPLQADQVYQLWLIAGDAPVSGGLFRVDSTGDGLLLFDAPAGLESYKAFGITPEPDGGSPGPTSPPVVQGSF